MPNVANLKTYARDLRRLNIVPEGPLKSSSPTTIKPENMSASSPLAIKRILKATRQNTDNSKDNLLTEGRKVAGQMATAMALREAWVLVLPSYGLSIIYLNIHAILRPIIPNYFSKVGWQYVPIFLLDLLLLIILLFIWLAVIAVIQIVLHPVDTAWSLLTSGNIIGGAKLLYQSVTK